MLKHYVQTETGKRRATAEMMQSFGQVLPPAHAIPLPSWMAMPVPTGTGCVHLPGGVLVRGGASRYDYPRVEIPEDADHPPVGIVLGAGAVGALTGARVCPGTFR